MFLTFFGYETLFCFENIFFYSVSFIFHFVNSFFCFAEDFSFDVVLPVYFFYYLCFISKIIIKTYVKELSSYVFLYSDGVISKVLSSRSRILSSAWLGSSIKTLYLNSLVQLLHLSALGFLSFICLF